MLGIYSPGPGYGTGRIKASYGTAAGRAKLSDRAVACSGIGGRRAAARNRPGRPSRLARAPGAHRRGAAPSAAGAAVAAGTPGSAAIARGSGDRGDAGAPAAADAAGPGRAAQDRAA